MLTESFEEHDSQKYYSNRNIAEECIKKHFEQIVGDWVPDWECDIRAKYYFVYQTNEKKLIINSRFTTKHFPSWCYFPDYKQGDIMEEVERMKTIYGKDIVKMYLTDTYT